MAICGAFLVQFFCSSAKTLRGRKDSLAQVYFYWGAIAPLATPPGSTPLQTNNRCENISSAKLWWCRRRTKTENDNDKLFQTNYTTGLMNHTQTRR